MQIFIKNAIGCYELSVESSKHTLQLFNNTLLLRVGDKENVQIESNGYEKNICGSVEYALPITWDKTNKCSILLKVGNNLIRYNFVLEGSVPLQSENISNLLKFASQMIENFQLDKQYNVSELFEAIKADKVALIIEKTPYSGYDNQSLLKKISETVPMVMDICSYPKQSLRTEEAVLDVNLVKRINSRTIDHLSSHSEHWKARTLNGLIPNRLRADIFEDEFNIYENLFFRMAIDDVLKYVHRQVTSITRTIEQNDNAIDWNAYGEALYDYKRMRIFEQLLPNHNVQERQNENIVLKDLLKQWVKLERKFSTVEASQFYRGIDKKKHISRNIQLTNILKKDSRYNALYRLWCEIQRQSVQEQNEKNGVNGGDVVHIINYYSMYVTVLLLYAFKLLECKLDSLSKFYITVNGIIKINATFHAENITYQVISEENEFGGQDIYVSFIEKTSYNFKLPVEVISFIDDIQKRLPRHAILDREKNCIVFYSKTNDKEQRELKNMFHLSASVKKGMSETEKVAKDIADKAWRPKLETIFSSDYIKDAKTETIRINPQYTILDNSEISIEKYTRILLESTKDSAVYTLPIDLSEYKKNIKSDNILYRLLNYGEKYVENEANLWGDYRLGFIPISQSEINSVQRLMKFISIHASRLQIKWNINNAICPVCGHENCIEESENNWKCINPSCNIIFGKTKHADGCGASYEWTRPSININTKDVVFGDKMNLMLSKEIIFDRLAITDFEFEKQNDDTVKYIPICPKCGKRSAK